MTAAKKTQEQIREEMMRDRTAIANYVRANPPEAERIQILRHWHDPKIGKYVAFIGFHINGEEPADEFIAKWSNKTK